MSSIGLFRTQLQEDDLTRKLIFRVGDHSIGAGYHVTELKLATLTSIDCGANQSTSVESAIQLLDAQGTEHMSVGKFAAIVDKSIEAIPDLADAPLRIEFAPDNNGKHIYQIGGIERTPTAITVALQPDRATCKPAMSGGRFSERSGCC